MKKNHVSLFVMAAAVLITACNSQGLKRTKSGLSYKIFSDKKNPVVKKGQFIKISFAQKVKDSLLFSSASGLPAYVPIDSPVQANYSPLEVFPLLRKGDSAIIIQRGDSIEKKSGQPLPPFIKKKDKIMLTLRVLDVFDNEEAMLKDRKASQEAFHQKEISEVADYVAKNNIQAQKTEKGTFVKIDNPGDGPAADSGKQVSVIYTGKMFPDGKVFESNEGKEPIKFVIGRRQVIEGWDDGLRLFRKGAKGTLYIPAFLAYDAQPGPGKKPNENLIFDVQVVDVTDAPAPKPMKPMAPAPVPARPKGK
ncbi:MAG TPA: FKBP-type peptidyl-prolyl cis-trans isomerase [Puia sp.]|nr:FKBP-type peptidyl-prolyl cis-trans isomerase [Puia sp.]